IPVSLTAAFILLAAFGYSVNLVTLLALVLAIGLVVDDAIVVLENIHRRIEGGDAPLLAAFNGARQGGFAVLATTAVLVAVFVPIMFLKDTIGRVFAELAVAICAAVIFSMVLALSLTPARCSKLLKPSTQENRFTHWLDTAFDHIALLYARSLAAMLERAWVAVVVALGVGGLIALLMHFVPEEYAPTEDQGTFFARIFADEGIGFDFMTQQMTKLEKPVLPYVESGVIQRAQIGVPGFGGTATNTGVVIVSLVPWQQRDITTPQLMDKLLAGWNEVP